MHESSDILIHTLVKHVQSGLGKLQYIEDVHSRTKTVTMTIRGSGIHLAQCSLAINSESCLGLPSIKYPRRICPINGVQKREVVCGPVL